MSGVAITCAMILAAGEGRRMRPLTYKTPKPLLRVAGKPLIEWHLQKLAAASVENVVINIAYLGEQIEQALGDGSRYGLRIQYSREPYPLETGGALNAALALLGRKPFLLVNGDIWSGCAYADLVKKQLDGSAAHLLLTHNPEHNPRGDFSLRDGRVEHAAKEEQAWTFSGLSIIDPLAFADYPQRREKFPLREYFDWCIARKALTGELYPGYWLDVGTPQRLQKLSNDLQAQHLSHTCEENPARGG